MNKIYSIFLSAILIFTFGCGSGETNLQIKIDGKDSSLAAKSSGTYTSTKTFSFTKDGQTTSSKAVTYYFALANYELDTSSGMISLDKPLSTNEQMRVAFQIVGEEGTDEKTPIKTGTYSAKADKFNKVDSMRIMLFADGKEVKNMFNIDKTEGEIKINSISGDTVSGEINLTEGDKSVKGSFTAKLLRKSS